MLVRRCCGLPVPNSTISTRGSCRTSDRLHLVSYWRHLHGLENPKDQRLGERFPTSCRDRISYRFVLRRSGRANMLRLATISKVPTRLARVTGLCRGDGYRRKPVRPSGGA